MAVLTALKLVTATRTNVVNPVAVRRAKLVNKLQDQLRLVEALLAGHADELVDPIADVLRRILDIAGKVRAGGLRTAAQDRVQNAHGLPLGYPAANEISTGVGMAERQAALVPCRQPEAPGGAGV